MKISCIITHSVRYYEGDVWLGTLYAQGQLLAMHRVARKSSNERSRCFLLYMAGNLTSVPSSPPFERRMPRYHPQCQELESLK